jgi:hypothetical protein
MMSGNIADLISDFSKPALPEGIGIGMLRRVRQAAEPKATLIESTIDHQAEMIQAAVAQARAEERETARVQLEQALNEERERHREDLALQRQLWVEQEALQLSTQIIREVGNLEADLSEKAARILTSVIPEALRQNAIAEFNEALGTILSGELTTVLRITGPKDVLDVMQAGMTMREGIVEFVPGNDVEVTLVAGDTTIQTQFNSWSERLQTFLKAEQS